MDIIVHIPFEYRPSPFGDFFIPQAITVLDQLKNEFDADIYLEPRLQHRVVNALPIVRTLRRTTIEIKSTHALSNEQKYQINNLVNQLINHSVYPYHWFGSVDVEFVVLDAKIVFKPTLSG